LRVSRGGSCRIRHDDLVPPDHDGLVQLRGTRDRGQLKALGSARAIQFCDCIQIADGGGSDGSGGANTEVATIIVMVILFTYLIS